MAISLLEIETFLAVARELHFTRAAAALHVTPGQVSKRVQRLERQIGGQVFYRSNLRVDLTPLGEQLRADLTGVVDALDAALAAARSRTTLLDRPLRLGFVEAFGSELDDTSTGLEAALTGQPVRPVEVHAHAMLSTLETGEVDLMLTWLALTRCDQRLANGPALGRRARLLAVGVTHPLARRTVIDVEELGDITLTSWPVDPRYEPLWRVASPPLTPAGRPLRHDPDGGRTITETARLLGQGRLAHLTIAGIPRLESDPAIRLIPLSGLPPVDYGLVWREDLADPAAATAARRVTAPPPAATEPERHPTRHIGPRA